MDAPPAAGPSLKDLVRALNTAADLLDILGEEAFRAAAYRSAARSLEREERPLAELLDLQFAGVPKVGRGIAADLLPLARGGHFAPLDEAAARVPPGVQELLKVRGLGPKKVRALWDAGIDSVTELRDAARSGRLAQVKGFGAKGAQALAEAAEFALSARDHYSMAQGLQAAEAVTQALQQAGISAQLLGDVARHRETVQAVDIALAQPAAAAAALQESGAWAADTETAGRWDGVPVRFVAPPAKLPAYWPYDEPEHAGLDLPAPGDLLQLGDIRGMLHTHTVWSDGTASARDMLAGALALGCRYYGTADHSQSAAYAGGLTPERLRAATGEVRAMQAEGLPILMGAEVDILADGTLDYPDDLLAELDYVVASVHSHFGLDQAAQTERLVRAVRHPLVDILGHPTGRLLLRRGGYAADMDAVLEACAETGTAAEINANPWRLDTDWRLALRWRGRVTFSVNTDAHSVTGLGDLRYGVRIAQKAGLTPHDVVNCLDLDAFRQWVRSRRAAAQ